MICCAPFSSIDEFQIYLKRLFNKETTFSPNHMQSPLSDIPEDWEDIN